MPALVPARRYFNMRRDPFAEPYRHIDERGFEILVRVAAIFDALAAPMRSEAFAVGTVLPAGARHEASAVSPELWEASAVPIRVSFTKGTIWTARFDPAAPWEPAVTSVMIGSDDFLLEAKDRRMAALANVAEPERAADRNTSPPRPVEEIWCDVYAEAKRIFDSGDHPPRRQIRKRIMARVGDCTSRMFDDNAAPNMPAFWDRLCEIAPQLTSRQKRQPVTLADDCPPFHRSR